MTLMAVAGAGFGALGNLQEGAAAKAQGEYQARVAEVNAKNARMKGALDAERISRHYDTVTGKQVAAAGASGVDPFSGSAASVMQETSANKHLDMLSTLWNAESSATSLENQATGYRQAGANARKGSFLKAGGTFLTGLGGLNRGARQQAVSIE